MAALNTKPVLNGGARLRLVSPDETFEKITTIDPVKHTVFLARTVRPSEASKDRYDIRTSLDYTGVTPAEMLELASRSIWIDVQRDFRKLALGKGTAAQAFNPETWKRISVREMLDRERSRGPVDPVNQATAGLTKLGFTPAQIEAMLKTVPAATS